MKKSTVLNGGDRMAVTYSSPQIAQAMGKQFRDRTSTVRVEMKYTREIGLFVRKVEAAHKRTTNSKLIFK